MKKSVGIIPYKYKDGNIMFFVGHPGGINNNYWAYLKGGVEDNEDSIFTALREFYEESGISLDEYKDKLEYLGQTIQNPHKEVAAYGIDLTNLIDIDINHCHSNLCDNGITPEIDMYRWMTWDELEHITHKSHKLFYEKIMHNFYYKHEHNRG